MLLGCRIHNALADLIPEDALKRCPKVRKFTSTVTQNPLLLGETTQSNVLTILSNQRGRTWGNPQPRPPAAEAHTYSETGSANSVGNMQPVSNEAINSMFVHNKSNHLVMYSISIH
ncbi:hypothetical protein Tco_0379718 [Tanacetum coccineum]